MAIDWRRSLAAAIESALESPPQPPAAPARKKPRLSGGRAVLLGAGLFTAGRFAMRGRGRDLLESLQDRLEGVGVGVGGGSEPEDDYDDEAEHIEEFDQPQDAEQPEDDVEQEAQDEEDPFTPPRARRPPARSRGRQ